LCIYSKLKFDHVKCGDFENASFLIIQKYFLKNLQIDIEHQKTKARISNFLSIFIYVWCKKGLLDFFLNILKYALEIQSLKVH